VVVLSAPATVLRCCSEMPRCPPHSRATA
jgi:hypothetical protein